MGLIQTLRNAVFAGGLAFLLAPALQAQTTQTNTHTLNAITNAASFRIGDVAPGGLATVFGQGLSDGAYSAQSQPLPTKLGPTELLLDGQPLPLLYAGPGQVNVEIPRNVSAGTHTLALRWNGVNRSQLSVEVKPVAPGTFLYLKGVGVSQYYSLTPNDPEHYRLIGPEPIGRAAKPGDILMVYGTGFGQSALIGGIPTIPGTSATLKTPAGEVKPVEVFGTYETGGFVGLNQTNLKLPPDLKTGMHELTICKADACAVPVGVPVWNGTDRYLNTYFWDVDNQTLFDNGTLELRKPSTNELWSTAPAFGMYIMPVMGGDAPLTLSVRSDSHYNWARTITPEGTNVLKQPVPMMQRWEDKPDPATNYPGNTDSRTGTWLDSLDHTKRMNGSEWTREPCGAPIVVKRQQLPVKVWVEDDVYTPNINSPWPPGVLDMVKQGLRDTETRFGYAHGQLFQLTDEQAPSWQDAQNGLTDPSGIILMFLDKTSGTGAPSITWSCEEGMKLQVIRLGSSEGTQGIRTLEQWKSIISWTVLHEASHLFQYGTGGSREDYIGGHSPYSPHIMSSAGPSKFASSLSEWTVVPQIEGKYGFRRINNLPAGTNWDEYTK